MTDSAALFPPLPQRPIKNTICLFDVDGTLTPARRVCSLSSLNTVDFANFVGCVPRDVDTLVNTPPKSRNWLRRWLRSCQATRTARYDYDSSHLSL